MKKLQRIRQLRLLAGGAAMLFATLAHAQYVWVDAKGIKQFSDRPPPPSIPLSKILNGPGLAQAAPEPDAAAADAPKPKAAPTLAERDAEYRKRSKAQAESEQKAADEAQRKAAKAENCELARMNKADLDSGVRIGMTDKNGERSFMSDEQRTQAVVKNKQVLAACQ